MKILSNLRCFCALGVALLLLSPAQAILDTNLNGMSDLWEKVYNNNNLLPVTFLASEDDDGDGWTNLEEAAAGTDPFNPNPPDGIVAITLTPSLINGAFTLTWPTFIGKSYQLSASVDLQNWQNVGDSFIAEFSAHTVGVNTTQPDNSVPQKVFWRVNVNDIDTDKDKLYDYEEFLAGTNSNNKDSDSDFLSDWQELVDALSALSPDSDGDGASDLEERLLGKDPLSANSHPPLWLSVRRDSAYGIAGNLGNRSSYSNWLSGGNFFSENVDATITQAIQREQLQEEQPFPDLPPEDLTSQSMWILNYQYHGGGSEARDLQEARVWIKLDQPAENDMTFSWLKFTEPNYNVTQHNPQALIETTIHEQIVRSGEQISEPADMSYNIQPNGIGEHSYRTRYIILERAPDVLAVNSDFDEGRLHPSTGYAIPDCDDIDGELHAERDHLDGKFKMNDVIFDDLHPGWFGLPPNTEIDQSFYEDAVITIKKLDVIDPSTGYKEEGNVRFYGVNALYPADVRCIEPYNFQTLAAVNLVTGGIKGKPTESVYGEDSPFHSSAKFFMEGVHPGYITLEWKLEKNGQAITLVQRFLVCTQKNAVAWRNELAYKIRLETSNDPSGEIDVRTTVQLTAEYWPRMEQLSEYYDFYQECYKQPLRSHPLDPLYSMSWPGLARLAGNQVVSALSDAEHGRRALSGIGAITSDDMGIDWVLQDVKALQYQLFNGGRDIFRSVGWQMHAFRSSGFWALDWVADNDVIDQEAFEFTTLRVWRDLYDGIKLNNTALLNDSAHKIAFREQNFIIVDAWSQINTLGLGLVTHMISIFAENPCKPLGGDFHAMFPSGSLANTTDRWNWTQVTTATGIIDTWNSAPQGVKSLYTADYSKVDAERFTKFPIFSILCNDDQDTP